MRSARQSGVQLMWMTPASIWRIARTAALTSLVNTPAPNPYGVELAYAMAVGQSSAVDTATAGPKSSSVLSGAVGDGLDLGHERVEEIAVHLRMGDDALDGDAHLAGVDVAAGRDGAGRGLDVRVGKDHDRARRAEFQGQLLHPGR